MTNILKALKYLIESQNQFLGENDLSHNRANSLGEALEVFTKDMFCNSFGDNHDNKLLKYSRYLSYIGNKNNPPDFILKGSDAVEVKKIENRNSGLALNSSYPKKYLYGDDTRITNSCRICEGDNNPWPQKDIIYAVGYVNNNAIQEMFFVYGDCYAANKDIYDTVSRKLKTGIIEIEDLDFDSSTNELGKIKKVDPLGRTYLRIRGMWHIINPFKAFNDYIDEGTGTFTVYVIMRKDKYNIMPIEDRQYLENCSNVIISDVGIESPDNPAQIINTKLIIYRL